MIGNTIFLGIEVATYRPCVPHWSRFGMARGSRGHADMDSAGCHRDAVSELCNFADVASGPIILALGLGLQNSGANRFNGVLLNRVLITGNLQKLGEEIVHRFWPTKGTASHGAGLCAAPRSAMRSARYPALWRLAALARDCWCGGDPAVRHDGVAKPTAPHRA
ncbi:hypothetical protein OZ411_02965 [Bradyrhizobium sp. Arg237L]|uniref:hypothetical protein n=1 Tax=Bradyrhizobium sp. Arg237L TaxID=3003352 RepID=UPI00249F175D|nr:hypothetical protein [Bradyrhizobium sp. Arg237L]MDI4231770.1 hypothetical protein [Bradyrhizobium sp. Arg237L]